MMNPELSRWAARVINTRYLQRRPDKREQFRAEVTLYDTMDDLPSTLRALGTDALSRG